MKIGEVCILTRDVIRMADFYRTLLQLEGMSDDPVHQILIGEEPMLCVCQDDGAHDRPSISLAFTVQNIDTEYERLQSIVEIAEPPTTRPWGARNMVVCDPDGNLVYLRQLGF